MALKCLTTDCLLEGKLIVCIQWKNQATLIKINIINGRQVEMVCLWVICTENDTMSLV